MPEWSTTPDRELERFRTIVEVAGEAIYTLNLEGRFTYVNDALLEQTGYRRAELLGEDVSLLLPEPDVERCEVAIEELVATDDRSRTLEIQVETRDGDRRDAEVTLALLPDETGAVAGTVGVARPLED